MTRYTTGNEITDTKLYDRFNVLVETIRAYNASFDENYLNEAFQFAAHAHSAALRKDGSPYITHPLETAIIMADMGAGLDPIIAALLHDTIEDTGFTHGDISSRFGKKIADLVEGVTKLTRIHYISKEEEQMENLRKMFLAMFHDIRVIVIKICDRLHNMRTIEYHKEDTKRREKALETMQVYAPLAHRLGMGRLKVELEDLALQCLDPVAYEEIIDELNDRTQNKDDFLSGICSMLGERMKEAGISAHIESRTKQIYSIYNKVYVHHKSMFELYDLFAVRVIVEENSDCFAVFGIVHEIFHPMPNRFKDYISNPKPNHYQSLHTTVIGREGTPFEVQIRTWEMHRVAEYGIAAHWKYKQGVVSPEYEKFEQNLNLNWVQPLIEAQKDTDAEEFIKSLRAEMFVEDVAVFTPRGDVITLPAGATPIDFAYKIHSAVGNRMSGAVVNGRIVTLDYRLQNGDIIQILSQNSHGPTRDWLKNARTSEARNKIKQWFKRERRDENIKQGKTDFEAELKRGGLTWAHFNQDDVLPLLLRKMSFASLDDLFNAIGYGGISALRAVNRIRDELVRMNRLQSDKTTVEKVMHSIKKTPHSVSGVIVEDIEDCLIKFARCCAPVPGDDIIGFVTKGHGISAHRKDCRNVVLGLEKEQDAGRWVETTWSNGENDTYEAGLRISCDDREGLTVDVATAVHGLKVFMQSIFARTVGEGKSLITLVVKVHGINELTEVINKIRRIENVLEVTRHGT